MTDKKRFTGTAQIEKNLNGGPSHSFKMEDTSCDTRLYLSKSIIGGTMMSIHCAAGSLALFTDNETLDELTDWLIQRRQERNLVDLSVARASRSIGGVVNKMLAHSV